MISPWDDRTLLAAITFSITAAILGLFGRGLPRFGLTIGSLILAFLSVFGYLGNHH